MQLKSNTLTIFTLLLLWIQLVEAQPPQLPIGLSDTVSPNSPVYDNASMPILPLGLDRGAPASESEKEEDDWTEKEDGKINEFSGFWEHRYGKRIHSSSLHDQTSINESRLHLAFDRQLVSTRIEAEFDLLYDDVANSHKIDLEKGEGWFDLRKLSLFWEMSPSVDLRAGRQVLTWGTGDLVFLNDLFPKDWHFWLGRDAEYMKDPSDALKLSWFNPFLNVDLVYTPRFDADNYITGERISFYDENLGRLVGQDEFIRTNQPDDWFSDDEVAIRLYKNIEGMELAFYGYDGYYKSPAGFDAVVGQYIFPSLSSLGASLRTLLGPGIFNLEAAFWQSNDDRDGGDPFIKNGENRYLIGYEWEAWANFNVGLQYYSEHMHDYNNYLDNLPNGSVPMDEIRELYTLRMTYLMLGQNLKLSWFSYYAPDNGDTYVRPEVNYKIDDNWEVELGGTLFDVQDDEPNAFFGQFEYNSNMYLMIRYNFDSELK